MFYLIIFNLYALHSAKPSTIEQIKKWHTPLFQCDMVYIVRLITGLMLFYTSFITVNHIRLHATYSRYLVLMVTAVMRGEMREWWMVIVVLLLPNVWPAETLPPASRDVQSFAELTWRCQHTAASDCSNQNKQTMLGLFVPWSPGISCSILI